MSSQVLHTKTERQLTLTLNAPERRNALSFELLEALATSLEKLPDEIGAVVLTGAGGAFSAGADFRELTGTEIDVDIDNAVERAAQAIITCKVPVIAAIEGACMGAGAHLALSCDARIAGTGSFLHIPAVKLGILYSPASLEWLSRSYPRDSVRRLMLLGERFDAEAARDAGFFSRVVPQGSALEIATHISHGIEPSDALITTKELLRTVESGRFRAEEWQAARLALLGSQARAEAIAAAKATHG